MLRLFLLLIVFCFVSCRQQPSSSPAMSDSVPTCNHALRFKHLQSSMPAWNVCDHYTSEDIVRISSFHIENDSLHLHQFETYDEPLTHDEEYTSDLHIIIPMKLVRNGKPVCVEDDSAQAVCYWQCNSNWDRELVSDGFHGHIDIWYRSGWDLEHSIMFNEDITFARIVNPTYKQLVRYKTFDFSDFGKHSIYDLPVRDSTVRHVWR